MVTPSGSNPPAVIAGGRPDLNRALRVAIAGVLPPLLLGLLVMTAHGAPLARPATNLAACVVGLLIAFGAGRPLAARMVTHPVWVGAFALGFELLTLAAPGIQGVHRWIYVAGVRMHPAALVDPILLLVVTVLWRQRRHWTAIVFVASVMGLRTVQPDAGQATALAAGALLLTFWAASGAGHRAAMVAVALGGGALVWSQPDPLPPMDFVENIVSRAFELHPGLGALAVLSMAALPAAALWPSRRGLTAPMDGALSSIALAAYLTASCVVVLFGEFPTPVLGFGASPVLGAILGLGLLNLLAHAPMRTQSLIDAKDAQQYFHGTKAALTVGDLIEPGRSSNFGKRKKAVYVYLTATLDAATWGAELAVGEGPGRIYVVEPTGPMEDDPNLTDKKFPGNPTKSYRTRHPLRVTGEITDWKGHPPEQLQAMRDHVARLAAAGVEAIED